MNCPICKAEMLEMDYFRDNHVMVHLVGANRKDVSHICPRCGYQE